MKISVDQYNLRVSIEVVLEKFGVIADADYEKIAEEIMKVLPNHENKNDARAVIDFADWMLSEPLVKAHYNNHEQESVWWHETDQRGYTTEQLHEKYSSEISKAVN